MIRILDAIPTLKIRKWEDSDVIMLFKILYWCALRPIEGIRLSKSDFSFNNRTISLGQTKTRKNDYAVIPLTFIPELKKYISEKEDGKLYDKLTYDTFYRWLKKLGKKLEILAWVTHQDITGEKTVGHIFRKTIGKDMLNGDVRGKDGKQISLPVISKHMRHDDILMTFNYYLKADGIQVMNAI